MHYLEGFLHFLFLIAVGMFAIADFAIFVAFLYVFTRISLRHINHLEGTK